MVWRCTIATNRCTGFSSPSFRFSSLLQANVSVTQVLAPGIEGDMGVEEKVAEKSRVEQFLGVVAQGTLGRK